MNERLPEIINFAQEEEAILEFWKERDVFQESMRLSKNRPKFSFYDGPPFATGLPHYGHILAGTIKDIVTRYAYQSGHHVERRFGWDCHGLPVETEIDTKFGLKGPDDVAKMGIKAYNLECRNIVMRYANEWEIIINRMGRWIDFKNDYKTMYSWYMESIWWIFSELYKKGLVYQGVKVMPYSTGCTTSLSNFEAGQNYKDVIDPSIVVTFPLLDEPGVSLLAWTTTPWTLPSNLALCANPQLEYVEVKDNASGNVYIMLEAQLSLVFKSSDLYTVQGRRKGVELKGKSYEPPFSYFAHYREKGAFRVLNNTYVTADTGTGIVHQAPYFGEDDFACCLEAGIINKDDIPSVCPVDSCGRFTEPVTDFIGKYVKDADKDIIKYLRSKNRLIISTTVKHSYPFCWRTDTPLIYKAVPSWFLKVEQFKDKLLTANEKTHWVPDYVKDKRFGNWLRDARDWAISRNRYWGNPMPLWISEDKKEIVCVSSIDELQSLAGIDYSISDIHRDNIDDITIPSVRPGHPPLRRVPEVFDCWFESGAMPYAQRHYPFECTGVERFNEWFPADFIAEGIDQTRGWFYTLLVIATALFDTAPYKNLIANGLILASDGQKMSKRKKNYPDPMEVVKQFGADALRLYLINSPVVRAENLRFKEDGVRDVIKDVFLPWYNAFRFLMQNIDRFEKSEKILFQFNSEKDMNFVSPNKMDQWIVSFTQSLLLFVKQEMQAYRLYTVVPHLIKYIEHLTNWYVRMNRKRIKGETNSVRDCQRALKTLFLVLYMMVRTNAPFTPFLTEFMFQRLKKYLPPSKENMDSVHYQLIPEPQTRLINENIEYAVSLMQTVIELGRIVRDRKSIPTKYPLREIVVIHEKAERLKVLLEDYILEELNVRTLTATLDKDKYGVTLRAEPDHKILGARLKDDFKRVWQAIKELTDEQLQQFIADKEITVLGHKLGEQDLRLMFSFKSSPAAEEASKRYEAHGEGNMVILLDIIQDEELYDEGIAREIINRVQKLRKKAQLVATDMAEVYYEVDEKSRLSSVLREYKDFIEAKTRTPQGEAKIAKNYIIISSTEKIKKEILKLTLVNYRVAERNEQLAKRNEQLTKRDEQLAKQNEQLAKRNEQLAKQNEQLAKRRASVRGPWSPYVNLLLVGIKPRFGVLDVTATVLLDSPKLGPITYERLREEIELIYGINDCSYDLYVDNKKITDMLPIDKLNKKTILVVKSGISKIDQVKSVADPFCDFININRCNGKVKCSILLENPTGRFRLNTATLEDRIRKLFDEPNFELDDSLNLKCGLEIQL
ncbi:probable isoleucine--tRNA ligase, cytoplasmic [Linepithema humile]|uniref:probable isoleucine--tRNA ligase, cytoplasmic n=1 Tax=Linepithema humile TaxID=83485 RepID=UPI00351EF28B